MTDEPTRLELTQLLDEARAGDKAAYDRVYRHLYAELKSKAQAQLARRPSFTIGATALVNETYLKLFDPSRLTIANRQHFLGLCVSAMRHILVDHHRAKHSDKRGSGRPHVALDVEALAAAEKSEWLVDIDEALDTLRELSPRLAQVVEFKFYLGLTEVEIGEALAITPRTVRMDWRKARAWLARELKRG